MEGYYQKSKKAKKDLHYLIQEAIKTSNKKNKQKHGKDLNIFSHLSVSDDENKNKKSKFDDSSEKHKYREPNPFSDSSDSSDSSACKESSDEE